MPMDSSFGRSGWRSHSRSQYSLSEPGKGAVQAGEQWTSRFAHDGPAALPSEGAGASRDRHVGLVLCTWLAFGVIGSQHVRQHGMRGTLGYVRIWISSAS